MASNLTLALASVAVLAGVSFLVDRRADFKEAQAEATHGPIGTLIDVDGTTVHALTTGSGPDLVMLHGASGNLRDYTFALIDALKDDFRITAFDRPGLGWTDPAGITPQAQARLLQNAALSIGVQNPIVFGHSFGGAVALAWALEKPDETAGLVLAGAVSNPWPGGLDTLYHVNGSRLGGATVVPLITAFAPPSRIATALEAIFAPQPVPAGYGLHIGAGLSLRRDSLRANARQILNLRPEIVEMSKHYGTLNMPVEILHGDADTIVPMSVHSAKLVDQLPDAKLTVLQGVGHMPHHARHDDIIEAIHRAALRSGVRKSQ